MSQRHATDVVSLVFGTVFAGFTVIWLVALNDSFEHVAWWAGPLVLVVAGVAGLVAALRPGRDAADDTVGARATVPVQPAAYDANPVSGDTDESDPKYRRFGG